MNPIDASPIVSTQRDPMCNKQTEALRALKLAHTLRTERFGVIENATELYGWMGALISGVEQDHWPTPVKDELRDNAREISQALDDAMKLWLASGRRIRTFRQLLPAYRVEGVRY
jgi:hypothetical protein